MNGNPPRSPDIRRGRLLWRRLREDPDLAAFVAIPLCRNTLDEFVCRVHAHFPPLVPLDSIRQSAQVLAGRALHAGDLDRWFLLLAVNATRLRRGPVYAWRVRPDPDWCVVEVRDVLRTRREGTLPSLSVTLAVLSGIAVGEVLRQRWSVAFAHVLARRLGFSSPRRDFPLHDVTELSGMRFFVRLIPGERREPIVEQLRVTSTQRARNRRTLRLRSRKDFVCPLRLPSSIRCYRCPAGRDRCPAATRPTTLQKKDCARCGRRSWVDPRTKAGLCLRCCEESTTS